MTVPPLPPDLPPPTSSTTPPPARSIAGVPWETARDRGLLVALVETVRRSLTEPVAFFRGMDPHGPLPIAIVYAVLLSWVGAAFQLLWQVLMPDVMWPRPEEPAAGLEGALTSTLGFVVLALLMPVYIPIVLVIAAGITHLVLLVLGGPSRGYRATLRVLCYTSSTAVISIVPVCGGLLALLWSTVLEVIGLREVHGLETPKAVAVVLIPYLVCAVVVGALLVVVLLVVAGMASG